MIHHCINCKKPIWGEDEYCRSCEEVIHPERYGPLVDVISRECYQVEYFARERARKQAR